MTTPSGLCVLTPTLSSLDSDVILRILSSDPTLWSLASDLTLSDMDSGLALRCFNRDPTLLGQDSDPKGLLLRPAWKFFREKSIVFLF